MHKPPSGGGQRMLRQAARRVAMLPALSARARGVVAGGSQRSNYFAEHRLGPPSPRPSATMQGPAHARKVDGGMLMQQSRLSFLGLAASPASSVGCSAGSFTRWVVVPWVAPMTAVLKAADKMIVVGAAMAGAALHEAAKAHATAIDGLGSKGVLSQADLAAINAGLRKAVASVPTSKVMDVYKAMATVIGSSPVPNYLFPTVNPNDAQAAYNAFLELMTS